MTDPDKDETTDDGSLTAAVPVPEVMKLPEPRPDHHRHCRSRHPVHAPAALPAPPPAPDPDQPILDALAEAGRPFRREDLLGVAGESRATVCWRMAALVQVQRVVQVPGHRWALPPTAAS